MPRTCAFFVLSIPLLACATVPVDAAHGTLAVTVAIEGMHLKALELQHQDYTHAVALTGFEPGQDQREHSVVAGPYCIERFVFDTGSAGGVIMPVNMCFEVAADTPTNLRIVLGADGRIHVATDRAAASSEPGLPPAGPG